MIAVKVKDGLTPVQMTCDPVLVLNSRQSKTPVGSDQWLTRTSEAVRAIIDAGLPVIASTGMNTWEMVLHLTGKYSGKAIIILPLATGHSSVESIKTVSKDFGLDPGEHTWLFVPLPKNSRSIKSWWAMRDRLAFMLAGEIVPVSVRKGGRLESYVRGEIGSEQRVRWEYRTGYKPRCESAAQIRLPTHCREFRNWGHLTHWTRRCYGPWPGEKSSEYYDAILESESVYPRDAPATLRRILKEGRLRGSGNHIRAGRKVVSFTSLGPEEAVPLMRWRKRYVRPTFEPYGIAIEYHAAVKAGIRPVRYISDREVVEGVPPQLMQGYGKGDWPSEKEWRAMGDVDLSDFNDDDITVIVPDESEAAGLRKVTRFNVVSLMP